MAVSLPMTDTKLLLSSFPPPSKPSLHRSYFGSPVLVKPFLRGTLCISRAGPESADSLGELFSRAESLFYTIADAAVSSSDAVASATTDTKQNSDWLSGITNYMEFVLKVRCSRVSWIFFVDIAYASNLPPFLLALKLIRFCIYFACLLRLSLYYICIELPSWDIVMQFDQSNVLNSDS